jgi:hypothetical protein
MKNILLIITLLVFLSACDKADKYTAIQTLDEATQTALLPKIVRYSAKKPKGITDAERFESRFDEYYAEKQKSYQWKLAFRQDTLLYFLVTNIAPSLHQKRKAIAGVLSYDKDFNITSYKEIFRTFKMKEDELTQKSLFLFDLMVNGKDLTPYYPENSQEEYIEFPDKNNVFDTQTRAWKVLDGVLYQQENE